MWFNLAPFWGCGRRKGWGAGCWGTKVQITSHSLGFEPGRLTAMTSGELGVEEGEDEILEGGGDVATRGTMRVKQRQKSTEQLY